MSKEPVVDESHPENSEILIYCRANAKERDKNAFTYAIKPYEMMSHQDLHDRIYEIGKRLTENCVGMAYGYPVLVYPKGGIIFALADSYNILGIRLPEDMHLQALASGAYDVVHFEGGFGLPPSSLNAKEFGRDWIFVAPWSPDEYLINWFRLAYEHAQQVSYFGQR